MAPSTEPFSFNCTICHESLNTTDRAPVVLPCGHTFLCEQCAKQLDKCMECRTPLSTAAPRSSQPPGPSQPSLGGQPLDRNNVYLHRSAISHSTLRSSHSARLAGVAPWQVNTPSYHLPPPVVAEATEERIPLPIPRNQVLMSLIKSVQESTNENEKDGSESGDGDGLVGESSRHMRPSTGTYVVREKNGLTVYAQKDVNECWSCTGDFFNMVEAPMSEVKRLVYDQKVELVSFEERVAVVGGGAGFITVDDRAQLVKGKKCQSFCRAIIFDAGYLTISVRLNLHPVGEAKEEICKLESAHSGLLEQLKQLERKKKKIEKAESAMAQKVKKALAEMENMDSCFGPEPPWEKLLDEETIETTERSHVPEQPSSAEPLVSVRDATLCEDGKVVSSPATEQTKSVALFEPKLPEAMKTSEPESPVSVRDAPPCEDGNKSQESKVGGVFGSFFSGFYGDHGVSDGSKDIELATGTPKLIHAERFIRGSADESM